MLMSTDSDENLFFEDELKKLKKENSKLRLQLGLGKSLADELEKQKKLPMNHVLLPKLLKKNHPSFWVY